MASPVAVGQRSTGSRRRIRSSNTERCWCSHTEHYYSDRWFDVQEVAGVDGRRKGWYCDIAEPAVITEGRISLVYLDLDVWVSAAGEVVILDEDEFAANPVLSATQRAGAREGLHTLLRMLEERQDASAVLR
jgi:protein associated with RNAse G/E